MRYIHLCIAIFVAAVFVLGDIPSAHAATYFFGYKIPTLADINQVKKVKAQDIDPAQALPVEQPSATTPQPVPTIETEPVDESENEEEVQKDFVDPQEIKNEVNQARDQLKQVNQVIARAKALKATSAVAELQSIKGKITDYQKKLKALQPESENAREVLEEFRNEQYWDAINEIRRKVELPKELAEIGKRIKEAEKLLGNNNELKGNKQVLSALKELGGDSEKLKAVVATIKEAYIKAQAAFDKGDGETAEEELQDIRDNGHPGELTGILNGMRQFGGNLRFIKDTEIRSMIKEIIKPIIDALNEGDIREARMTIDELGPEIEKTMQKAMKLASKNRKVFIEGLDKLEQRINEKLEQEALKNEKPEELKD